MRIPRLVPLSRLLARAPRPSNDYRVFDMRKMIGWGHSAFWWPQESVGERACLFGPRPRIGDVLVSDSESGLGWAFVIVSVETPRDPGDQHFVEVVRWGRPADLPPREPRTDRSEDWIQ